MIIDAHVHLVERKYDWHGISYQLTLTQLIRTMKDVGIDKAVIFPTYSHTWSLRDQMKENEAIARAAKRHPDKLLGFCRIDPHLKGRAVKELDRCVQELGLIGLKLHPLWPRFLPSEDLALSLVEEASALRIPIFIHCGDDIRSNPLEIEEVVQAFPGVPMILGHSGGSLPATTKAIQVAKRNENVYLETSTVNDPRLVRKMVKEVGASKVFFGSDAPWQDVRYEKAKIKYAGLTETEERLVYGEALSDLLSKSYIAR
ncbi:MAG: amidohydrolase family protein [Candidatus Heimdallarchaeota archaeon]